MQQQTRRYQSSEDTQRKFDALLLHLRASGQLLLPPERELCALLDCARGNLRAILRAREEAGDIVKKGRHRALSLQQAVGREQTGRFAFVAPGEGRVYNLAWNKLWARLQPLAEGAGIAAELVLLRNGASRSAGLDSIRKAPELLVLARGRDAHETGRILALPGKRILCLDESYCGADNALVCVDNMRAGELAAEKLAAHGYRRPVMLFSRVQVGGRPYGMFQRRAEGFRAGCRACGLEFSPRDEFWEDDSSRLRFIIRMARLARTVRSRGYDCAFIYSDETIEYLYCALVEEGLRIPQEFGVVTVNSFDHARLHQPPIAAVSHATGGVAHKLTQLLQQALQTGDVPSGRHLVRPRFHPGATLR